jgi:diguanylate cyclase (GGDEF)-like protein
MPKSPPLKREDARRAFILGVAGTAGATAVAFAYDHLVRDNLSLTPLFLLPIIYCSMHSTRPWVISHTVVSAVGLHLASRAFSPSDGSQALFIFLQFVTYNMVAWLTLHLRVAVLREGNLAREDALTGLANARAFDEIAGREIDRMRRSGKPLSVLYFDVDHFKKVNDTQGHRAGDKALQLVGSALTYCTRDMDVAARTGGDEFALLMPETDEEGVRIVTRRLQNELNERSSGKITCSIGCVTFPDPPLSVDAMLAATDDAMYAAKAGGRNRAVAISRSFGPPRSPASH